MTMQTCVLANKLRRFYVKKLQASQVNKNNGGSLGDALKLMMKFLVCLTRICLISCSHTVDGSEIRRSPVELRLVVYPVIYRVLYIPVLVQDLFHQQYG